MSEEIRPITQLKTFINSNLASMEADFATWTASLEADTTKVFSINITDAVWDGSNYVLFVTYVYTVVAEITPFLP